MKIPGYCPMGCGETLIAASGGYITCSYLECPVPDAVSTILADRETEHIVELESRTFSVQRPLRERLNGDLFRCDLHQRISNLDGPPGEPGKYRVGYGMTNRLHWERLDKDVNA